MRTFLILSLCVASAARAQTLPDKLSRDTRDSLVLVIEQASAAGLPTAPLYAKAAEGVLKRADEARILAAVRNLSRALVDARAALPPGTAAPTMIAAASALQAGAERAVISRYATISQGGQSDLAIAYVTLADLIASTVPAVAASRSVEQLLRSGFRESDLATFRAAVVRDIQAGAKPEDALRTNAPAAIRPPTP